MFIDMDTEERIGFAVNRISDDASTAWELFMAEMGEFCWIREEKVPEIRAKLERIQLQATRALEDIDNRRID